ncbi:hypothetical protein SERLADRAFT_446751 [Serpula lacrymans var. lacrymans S7.9]|uniref:ATPase AAA-type core domain-containing protein n=1 Tax=Serpula lacrymans var. lacrymans (strain S7.9) TaxID=578457 RepID=F8NN24_SERL9|nr:uncharacterized protein SERLADRAFT_446751 [Serpula lacrymans var. lacrymans S7.9]EGO27518.1 hypothetical protein SERLADRAFT_446751 [Serpula lacrymans var. lacrymans S7.9]
MEDPTTSILGNQAGRSEPNFRHDFTDLLTNTILLSGPPGCGKTAAVYACAEELGYEVFEVYPGIGRRNGASLDSLIGDVGKNHLIQKSSNDEGRIFHSL